MSAPNNDSNPAQTSPARSALRAPGWQRALTVLLVLAIAAVSVAIAQDLRERRKLRKRYQAAERKLRAQQEREARELAEHQTTKESVARTGGVPALTPEQEQKSFQLDDRFRVELVASEPLVQDPVALAFAPDGRLWVCEMRGYMRNLQGDGENEPSGRIVVLEDTDGDGRMDKSTVFLDGLVMPRTIALVKDGVLVGEPPRLLYCRDTDGDGKADEKTEVDPKYAHTADANPEHMANGLLWSLDNWIYSAKSATAYRLLPDGKFEQKLAPVRGQWGLTQDDWGRLFYNYNVAHLHGDLTCSQHYHDRNRHTRVVSGVNEKLARDERVWPIRPTPGVNGGSDALEGEKLRAFTSACGPVVYRGGLFPPEYRGNVFSCEPAGNLIKRDFIEFQNGMPSARTAVEGREFLASTDERFRPVNLYSGPDGALWVVDMYRGVIEHKKYMTDGLREYVARQGLEQPTSLGRIWRIVPKDASLSAWPTLAHSTTAELVATLQHPNGWQRDTAQRLLVETAEVATAPALKTLSQSAALPQARVHALWTLDGLGQLDAETVRAALDDSQAGVRTAAVRLSERFLKDDRELVARLLAMVSDPAPEVLLQVALTLSEIGGPEAEKAMLALVAQPNDFLAAKSAVLAGLSGRELEFLAAVLGETSALPENESSKGVLALLVDAILNERKPERCAALLELLPQQKTSSKQSELLTILASRAPVARSAYRPIKLEQQPAGWADLATTVEVAKLKTVGDLFTWPGKPSPLETRIDPLSPEQQRRYEEGRTLYAQICAACHQPHGQGLEGLAPPLVNSEWVLGSDQRLIRVALHGLVGPITVGTRTYDMEMPGFAALPDEQLAAILTYIRREWDHGAEAIEPDNIAEVRAVVGVRNKPWSKRTLTPWSK